jgi:hypothetical protein
MHQFSSGSALSSGANSQYQHHHSLARQPSMSTLPSFMQQDEEEENTRLREMEDRREHEDRAEELQKARNRRVMLEDQDAAAGPVGVFI